MNVKISAWNFFEMGIFTICKTDRLAILLNESVFKLQVQLRSGVSLKFGSCFVPKQNENGLISNIFSPQEVRGSARY